MAHAGRYHKRRPDIPVHAVQWFPGTELKGVRECAATIIHEDPDRPAIFGFMRPECIDLDPGDWVLGYYPDRTKCSQTDFEATYEPEEEKKHAERTETDG